MHSRIYFFLCEQTFLTPCHSRLDNTSYSMQNLLSLYILHVKYIKIINLYEGIFWVDPKNLSTHKCGAESDAVVLDQSAVDMVPGDVKFPADNLSALSSFKKLSDEDVRALVTKSAKSYCTLDPMPMTCFSTALPRYCQLFLTLSIPLWLTGTFQWTGRKL